MLMLETSSNFVGPSHVLVNFEQAVCRMGDGVMGAHAAKGTISEDRCFLAILPERVETFGKAVRIVRFNQ